jgi:predicted CoA-substrate-specific enzyme activase
LKSSSTSWSRARNRKRKEKHLVIVAGCDVGSTTGKAVILKDGEIAAHTIMPCKPRPGQTAELVMGDVMQKLGLSSLEDLDYIVGTGYGRLKIPFADDNISEITCHGVGAYTLCESVRTIIDIGGQDLKVIGLDDDGKVIDFVMNDKCAAGTGRYLENQARALELTVEQLSQISLQGTKPALISTQCSVFAESEVITLLNDGEEIANIANGIHEAIASRLLTLVRRVGARNDVTIAGGCAKNVGLIDVLEKRLDTALVELDEDPQIVGAFGAACLAARKLERTKASQ